MASLRIILVVVLLGAIYLVIKKLFSLRESDNTPSKPTKMVACKHCGVYIPKDDAVIDDLKNFCCAEHRKIWFKNNADNT